MVHTRGVRLRQCVWECSSDVRSHSVIVLCNCSKLATMVPQPRSTVAGSSHILVTVLEESKTLPLEQWM